MDESSNQKPQEKKKVAYVCEGTCQAQITQEEYDGGLKVCGEKTCTNYGKPFKKVETEPQQLEEKSPKRI